MADSFYLMVYDPDDPGLPDPPGMKEVKIADDWNLIADLDSKTSFSCTITDLQNLTKLYTGVHVQFFNYDDETLFDGFIKTIEKEDPFGNDTNIYYRINCVCWCKIAERRLIGNIIENKTVEDVIIDYILPILAEEGITEGYISCELEIERISFQYITCYEALNLLQNLMYGYIWYIADETKTLNFFYIANSYLDIKLDSNIYYRNFKQSRNMSVYRNTQYLRGGKARTNTQSNETPSPTPDGNVRTFICRFPLAEEPTIEVNIGGGGWVAKTCGVNGIDSDGSHDFYFTYDSPNVTQDSNGAVLAVGDFIRITYIGLRDLFIIVDDQEQIRRRATIEDNPIGAGVDGCSGIYENIVEESSMDNIPLGIQFSSGILKKYGDIADNISFETENDNFKWSMGSLLKVEKDNWNINEYFLVKQVSMSQLDPTHIQYNITALDGAAIGGWEQYFADLLKRDKKFTINDSEVLVLLKNQFEKINHNGEYEIKGYKPLLYVSESTLVSESTILGGTKDLEVSMYD
jgi:hypothetical protein